MINLQKITVRKRLMLIFAIWITVFFSFGILAIKQMYNLGNVARRIYDYPLPVSNASIEARADITKIQRNMEDMILSRNQQEIQQEIEKIRSLDQKFLTDLDIIKSHTTVADSIELEKRIREVFLDWRSGREEVIDLVKKGNIEEAVNLTKDKFSVTVDELEGMLVQIDNNSRAAAENLLKESENLEDRQRRYFIFAIGLLSASFLGAFIITIRSILRPINKLKDAMNRGIETGELFPVNIEGKNEISDMSRNYNVLIRKLTDILWIKDSKNNLSQELSGYISLEELTQRTINFLCRSVSGGKGVFYIYDRKSNLLKLKSSYAFTKRDKAVSELSIGEGIVGQVALEKKAILTSSIKNEDNVISTAIISQTPVNTYAFPLLYEDELYGVIEIASLKIFDKVKIEFLNEVSTTIGINLYSALQNEKIKELLKLSEESSEEMRRKAEELEIANSGLSRQQKILQQQAEELQQVNTELEEQQQMLQQQSEELQQTNLQLEEQRQQLEEQTKLLNDQKEKLEESKKELQLSNKYKSEFLANMSHELRTPLNSIILLSKLLLRREKEGLSLDAREKIDIINKSGQELLRLINEVLDLSKIESGRMSVEKYVFHSSSLVEEIKDMFESLAREKGLKLQIEDNVNRELNGDELKISQILRNFISNAIKFTEKGSISVRIEKEMENQHGILFSVSDTGIGISEEQQKIIFEEFQQGDGSVSRKFGGTGLGLSISKKLAEIMGGKIRVNSKPGHGSEFTLCIPEMILPFNGKLNDIHDLTLADAEDEAASTKMECCETLEEMDKIILVIEDNKAFGDYVKSVIEGMGFRALVARSGRKGLNFAREYRPKGILLDLGLPDISGMDVLRELKSTKELRNIPVHIISIHDRDNKAQRIGAIGYNQKPVEENEIIKLVSQMIDFADKNPKKLLLIEDNRVQQEYIKELIEDSNVYIRVVDTEEAAKDEINGGDYDVIILDLELREGNGLNVCEFIGRRKVNTPVIVYTGRDLTLEQEKRVRKFADSIILKTANSEERLLDEVTLFLHMVKKNNKYNVFSKTNEEYTLSLEDKTILIVDDDPRNVYTLASVLEEYKAKVLEADNGKTALERLNEYKVDLILMDIMMPEMDGYEAIKQIRKNDKLKNIPIIALTAKCLKEDREKCIEVGANDYIPKPVDYDSLIRLIKAWIIKE